MKVILIFAAILGVVLTEVYRIELKRIQSKRSKMMADGTWPAYVKYKVILFLLRISVSINMLKCK